MSRKDLVHLGALLLVVLWLLQPEGVDDGKSRLDGDDEEAPPKPLRFGWRCCCSSAKEEDDEEEEADEDVRETDWCCCSSSTPTEQ